MLSKHTVKRMLPERLLRQLRRARAAAQLSAASRYDRRRYSAFSSTVDYRSDRRNLASKITESYHNLEKGLSLPAPRPGFGASVVERLIELTFAYADQYGHDHVTSSAAGALRAYVEFNASSGVTDAEIPHHEAIQRLLVEAPSVSAVGGTRSTSRTELHDAVGDVDERFFLSRASVRQFDSRPVARADIETAVRIAQKSPAVCNRQFSRVYLIDDSSRIATALRIQGGARGFDDVVPTIGVITSSVRTFWAAGERAQPWTDGGMFAMSFLLGLHAQGLGAVPLNWSKTAQTDREFHAEFDIPEDEVIVMLVAFGHVPEEFHVASSPRIPVDEALFQR